ncbi:TetR/AcrR family transcriptional regulator [Rhizobium halophytocola]|uniref:AcrR family transcriptional regulator n=1 Tax=Rhizobium halophytocola TaxID=735519 RepID=A0ABS4E3S1_9HYPH|nr:TetR/AcrR family transcriptional regulator [Rhizobium halophytocola]MBP1852595.1 AcrR family transcriptional regulator [Rhizobium halophytocola]
MGRPKGGGGDAAARLLEAAGRGFRTGGYGGIGVDALAKEAGLTSGAFYAHFGSKAEAFHQTVMDGLAVLDQGVAVHQAEWGPHWLAHFVDFYLGDRMMLGLDQACVLPGLSADVARAPHKTRKAYADALSALADRIAGGLGGDDARERAYALLAQLSGAASLARAVTDETVRETVLQAAAKAAKAI